MTVYFQWKNEGMGQDTSFLQGGLRELPFVKCRGTHDNMTERQVALHGSIGLLCVSYNLAKHAIQFQIGDDLGSDHLPTEISIDAPPHRNSHTNHTKYKFDQTDREVFESTLETAL